MLTTYVPSSLLAEVKSRGLFSGERLLQDKALLARIAKAREQTTRAFKASIVKQLTGFKPDSAKGVNVLFSPPPEGYQLNANHPLNKRKLTPVQIDLDRLLREQPATKVHGQELMPYAEYAAKYTPEQLAANADDPSLRHRYLKPKELQRLRGLSAAELWKNYKDVDNVGMYAPDVPHAALVTPQGNIEPKYLKFS